MRQHKWHIGDNRIDVPRHPKEWQGLTDDEVIDLIDIDCPPNKAICGSTKGIIKLAKAIEQKLKEKNHGTT